MTALPLVANPEISDVCAYLDAGLSIARACLMLYLEDTTEEDKFFSAENIHDIRQMLGAVIDYMLSAQRTLEEIEGAEA